MSDGLPKHDWRELAKKTQAEIRDHRGLKPGHSREYFSMHYSVNGSSYCGQKSSYYQNLSEDKTRVDCNRCLARLSRINADAS